MTTAYVFAPAYSEMGTSESPSLLDWVDSRLNAGATYLLVDLQKVTQISSSGLGTLMIARNRARRADSILVLCSLNSPVQTALERADMLDKFQVYADRRAFEQQINALANG
ncbi:MAG: STAS domain-containing protein [Cyanobacteria bacterium P01_A01_bin.135]